LTPAEVRKLKEWGGKRSETRRPGAGRSREAN
jgi:hypothetical protein